MDEVKKHRRLPRQMKLGDNYIVFWYYGYKMVCKFIQPTKCGFNLLNLKTNKCILKQHVYPSKWEAHSSGDWFWFNDDLKFENL